MSSPTFIISGDIHLRIKPDLPEEWQMNRYRRLWEQYVWMCLQHKAKLILSGDIFDNHKISSKEMMLFTELCTALSSNGIDTWIIDGNHDYTDPNSTTLDHFQPLFDSLYNAAKGTNTGKGAIFYAKSMVAVFGEDIEMSFISHSQLLNKSIEGLSDDRTNILISHFRPNVNEFIKEEINVSKFVSGFDYTFCSDIHIPLELPGNIVYTNSPLNSSFESSPVCGCLLVRCNAKQVTWERLKIDLPNLVQITVTPNEYLLGITTDPKHYYRVTVNGSAEELRGIKSDDSNVKLLKVPEVAETYTDMEECKEVREQAMDEALIEYMKELKFDADKIKSMMEVFYGA